MVVQILGSKNTIPPKTSQAARFEDLEDKGLYTPKNEECMIAWPADSEQIARPTCQ